MIRLIDWRVGLASTFLLLAAALPADEAPTPASTGLSDVAARGAEIFRVRCDACHEPAIDRAPAKSLLRTLSPGIAFRALKAGVMRQNAAGLSDEELGAIVVHLTGRPPGSADDFDVNANSCRRRPGRLVAGRGDWNGWGGQGLESARYQRDPGMAARDVPRLALKWAFAYPGGAAGRQVAFVGGLGAEVRALDAGTGAELWRTRVDGHATARLNGGSLLHEGLLYVPVGSSEEAAAGNPSYPCCSFRGSLVAIHAETGRVAWQSYMIEQPPVELASKPGRLAPAGAAIWTAPAVDRRRGLIYAGTGDAYTEPAPRETDAVIAFDLKTGKRRWVRQLVADDVWLAGCEPKPHANCPQKIGPDFDLGGPMLARTADGREVVLASSKSGAAWGLDPDREGAVIWHNRLGRGGTRGGIEWGGSTDGQVAYYPVSDAREGVYVSTLSDEGVPDSPGLNAVDVATGRRLWHTPSPMPDCVWGTPCVHAQPAAPTLIPGVVFSGSWDGHIRAYATEDGRIIWDFDTGNTFAGVNGKPVTGGSIDRGAQSVARGMLFVNSGVRQRTGNALLAFTVDGK
jgi:polyvinyl alcohol dehydrogenase (cytochrome)